MDPTRPRRKISAGLSVGRAFHPIIAVNRFASFLFFPFSLSPSLPLCGAVAYRLEAIHPFSRKTGLSLSFSFSLSIFLFPSRPVPGTHHRVSSFHPIARMGSREFLVLHCSFPSLGRNRRCSNSRTRETPFLFSLSLFLALLQPRMFYEVLRGSRLVKLPPSLYAPFRIAKLLIPRIVPNPRESGSSAGNR